jgi:hypothetical protein
VFSRTLAAWVTVVITSSMATSLSGMDHLWFLPPRNLRTFDITTKADAKELPSELFDHLYVLDATSEVLKAIPPSCAFTSITLDKVTDKSAAGIAALAGFPDLRNVRCFGDGALTAAVLAALLSLENVEDLTLWGFKTIDGLAAGRKHKVFKNLRALRLSDCGNPGQTFWQAVVDADCLTTLELEHVSDLQNDGVWFLTQLSHLGELTIWSCNDIDGFVTDTIRRCASLKHLRIQVPLGLNSGHVRQLAGATALEELDLTSHLPLSWEAFLGLTRLTSLSVDIDNFSDAGADELGKLKQLRRLNIAWMGVGKTTLESLALLPALSELEIGSNPEVDPSDLEHLAKCKKLTSLAMCKTGVGGDFSWVKHLTELKRISIWIEKGFTDDDIAALCTCAKLEAVELCDVCGTTEKIGPMFGALPLLHTLVLSNSVVTNTSMEWLAKSKTLRFLDIRGGNKLTNDFVLLLIEAPALEYVDLYACNSIKQEAVAELKTRRRDLVVRDHFDWQKK